MLATLQGGLQCPKETCKRWTGGKLLWGMVFQTTRTHVMNFPAPRPVVKHDAGKTAFRSYLKIRTNDVRDFTPKMIFLRTFEIFESLGCVVKCPILGDELNHQTKEGVFEEVSTMKVTGGQLATMSLVPGTVDSNVTSECHILFKLCGGRTLVMPTHSQRAKYSRNAHRWCAVIR